MSFAQVALPLPLRRTFTYSVPDELAPRVGPGVEVQVPFRGRPRKGFVVEVARDNPLPEGTEAQGIALTDRLRALQYVTGDGARFLWVPNLLRPDIALALIAGLTTALMMAANPDLPEHVRILMIVVPTVLAIFAALKLSSALAIYWTASNTFSAIQTLALHAVVRRRVRSGAISL